MSRVAKLKIRNTNVEIRRKKEIENDNRPDLCSTVYSRLSRDVDSFLFWIWDLVLRISFGFRIWFFGFDTEK